MNVETCNNIYQLLAENNFEIGDNNSDELKCLKCRKTLINACQGPCGCRYCRVCVDGLLESGCQVCPGNAEYCRETILSNFQTDFIANIKISKFLVKCPLEMCPFKSELININDHLRVCPNKCLKCVFYDLGCSEENVTAANMNEHLQLENHNHMTMLMGIINNMRNEMDRLKEDLMVKTEKIELLEEEIKSINEQKIDNLHKEIVKTDAKMDTGLREMRQEWTGALDRNTAVVKQTIDKYQTDMAERMNRTDKWMDKQINGTLEWTIDKIAERRKKGDIVWSEYFYGKMRPYRMVLEIALNGFGNTAGSGLTIWLYIRNDFKDEFLIWPLKAKVTLTITNNKNTFYPQNPPNPPVNSLTKDCTIDKPVDNSCKFCTSFDFNYGNLSSYGYTTGDFFTLNCTVDVA